MKTFKINKNDANQRLDKFIFKAMPSFPNSLLQKLIRKKDVKLNGKRTEAKTILCEGDVITIYIKEETFFEKEKFSPEKVDLSIVYEDENIVVIDKKAGVMCQSDKTHSTGTLAGMLKSYLFEKGVYNPENEQSFVPALCNRLDTNTVGLVIGAKNAMALREMNYRIKMREVHKYYLCKTEGIPPKDEDRIVSFITKDDKKNKSKITSHGKEIITTYKVLKKEKNTATVEIELETGRSHQIRAQMANIGCPLFGDKKYGAKTSDGQKLCAYKLKFTISKDSFLSYLNDKEILSNQTL